MYKIYLKIRKIEQMTLLPRGSSLADLWNRQRGLRIVETMTRGLQSFCSTGTSLKLFISWNITTKARSQFYINILLVSRSIISPCMGSRPIILIILQEEWVLVSSRCQLSWSRATWSGNPRQHKLIVVPHQMFANRCTGPSSWHMLDWFVSNHRIFSDSIDNNVLFLS